MSRGFFRKQDNDAITIIIVVVLSFVVLVPLLFDTEDKPLPQNSSISNKNIQYAQEGINDGSIPASFQCELFPFDPNTADSTQFLRLGLKPWQVRSIYKYRSKGGRFYRKEDFARLYGLTLEKYKQLEPYIRIKEEPMAADYIKYSDKSINHNIAETERVEKNSENVNSKIKRGEKIDINTADTTELKRIPGIGSYFARRIVDLRARKKVFSSKEELLEGIRNFPENALEYMSVSQNFPVVHINKVTEKELRLHPLINYTQARDICMLRRQSGSFHSVKELSLLPSFTSKQLEKLAKFLIFD